MKGAIERVSLGFSSGSCVWGRDGSFVMFTVCICRHIWLLAINTPLRIDIRPSVLWKLKERSIRIVVSISDDATTLLCASPKDFENLNSYRVYRRQTTKARWSLIHERNNLVFSCAILSKDGSIIFAIIPAVGSSCYELIAADSETGKIVLSLSVKCESKPENLTGLPLSSDGELLAAPNLVVRATDLAPVLPLDGASKICFSGDSKLCFAFWVRTKEISMFSVSTVEKPQLLATFGVPLSGSPQIFSVAVFHSLIVATATNAIFSYNLHTKHAQLYAAPSYSKFRAFYRVTCTSESDASFSFPPCQAPRFLPFSGQDSGFIRVMSIFPSWQEISPLLAGWKKNPESSLYHDKISLDCIVQIIELAWDCDIPSLTL